ncbi:hypothetical protein GQ54DRAFT_181614 [Martensiomyces pterosporus]|nr:hypothetical protein GQ54DRAFT_181614 [Martensiomyces pterosporus]
MSRSLVNKVTQHSWCAGADNGMKHQSWAACTMMLLLICIFSKTIARKDVFENPKLNRVGLLQRAIIKHPGCFETKFLFFAKVKPRFGT